MQFFYEAVDAQGQRTVDKMEARDAMELERTLARRGYRVVSVAPVPNALVPAATGQTGALKPEPARWRRGNTSSRDVAVVLAGNAASVAREGRSPAGAVVLAGRVSAQEQMLFFQQLAQLVRSGMTVHAALDHLGPRVSSAHLSRAAEQMAQAAQRGERISDVMAAAPEVFPEHVVGLVRAGEMGGFLEIALDEVARGYERNIALYRGTWLPRMMATQAFFLLALALPLFPTLLRVSDTGVWDLAANLQEYLRVVLLRNLPVAAAVYYGIRWCAARVQMPSLRRVLDTWALRVPLSGDLQRYEALSGFLQTLGRLYHAGVAPIHAWEGAACTAGNTVLRERLIAAGGRVQQGASLPEAFAATGLFDHAVEQLLVTGHYSGQVESALESAAALYRAQAEEAAKRTRLALLRLGTLALLLFGGAAVLWMAKTYFSGIFQMVERMFPEVYGGEM
ncbi:MAG: type II secretion system F family protein [Chloroherpetonaceae bacterium]|nr:type II secretion system F family protein [Chthonomonadaceae bacterium]MDW8206548.1 type II secretion system F family protein [Chloroherpetonaceae bacterium]